jgi:hypothetical protein
MRAARRAGAIVAAAIALELAAGGPALAQRYTVDSAGSEALTAYLRKHRLPLVGAQVLKGSDGGERLVLYGFVATNHGRKDAERRALAFLGDEGIPIEDRIVVRPEIARMKASGGASENVPSEPGEPAPASSGGESLDNVLNDIAHFGINSAPRQ